MADGDITLCYNQHYSILSQEVSLSAVAWEPMFQFAFCCCNKTLTKTNTVDGLHHLPSYSPSLKRTRTGTHDRKQSRDRGGRALTGLFSSSRHSLLQPRPHTAQEQCFSQWAGPSTYISNQENVPRCAHGPF